jgi:hypothetical protein
LAQERKNYDDEVRLGWISNKDREIVKNFNNVVIRESGFEVRRWGEGTGLSLARVGYETVEEHLRWLGGAGRVAVGGVVGVVLGGVVAIIS